MTMPEFLSWVEFNKLYPFDDLHRYHRPAAAVGASNGGKDAYRKILDLLAPEPLPPGMSLADWNTYKAFGVSPRVKKED